MNAFHEHHHRFRKLNTIGTSLGFIIVGIMFLGHNLGWIDSDVFHTVVSWQMLLIYIGVFQLLKRNIIGGLILIAVGSYLLLPVEFGLGAYWPVLLIAIGIGILFKLNKRSGNWGWSHKRLGHRRAESAGTENGYVNADVNFGGTKHIVLDPVFKGANIDVSFGSMVLDLRRTSLEEQETYIDLDCNFGGIEIYIPGNWNVVLRTDNSFGATEDKRILAHEIDYEHELIIRGDVNFGGVDIKS